MSSELLNSFVLPVITLIVGWLSSAYRNKQKKEKDILENVQQIIDIQKAHISASSQIQKELEIRLDLKSRAIRRAYECDHFRSGQNCPVIKHEEENENILATLPCDKCEHYNTSEQ